MTKKIRAGKRTQKPVQYTTCTFKTRKEAVETPTKKFIKKMDEPCKDVLAFPDIGEMSLLKNNNYKASVPIGLEWPDVHPIICVLITDAGLNLIRTMFWTPIAVQYPPTRHAWHLNFISHQVKCVWNDERSHVMGELFAVYRLSVVSKLVVTVRFGTTYIDRCIKLIYPDKRRIVLYYFRRYEY